MTENKEVVVLKSQISKLEKQADEIVIATPEENVAAMNLKAKLKEIGKQITTQKETITKPLNTALKNARELFRPLEEKYEFAENLVGRKLLDYKRKVDEEARAKEAKIAADLESGKIKKMETAERHLDKIEKVDKTTHTDHGMVQFKKIKKVRVTDETKIPDKYWVVDMVAVRKDALAGLEVPGAEVYEEEIV